MNATLAKELLLPIPKNEFIIGEFSNNINKCCAIGHLVRLTSKKPNDYEQELSDHGVISQFCRDNVTKFISQKYNYDWCTLASINNSDSINNYNEIEIKDRVIHLLDDMIEAGY